MTAGGDQLTEIAKVRRLQLAAAEVSAGEAKLRLNQLHREAQRLENELTVTVQAWSTHMQGARLDLTLAAAWSENLEVTQQALARVRGEIQKAAANVEQQRLNWKAASVRSENAVREVKNFGKHTRRCADEKALIAASDLWPYMEAVR